MDDAPGMCYYPEVIFHRPLTSTQQAVDLFLHLDNQRDLELTISEKNWQHLEDLEVSLNVSLNMEPSKL
jgi:hypothetical protein